MNAGLAYPQTILNAPAFPVWGRVVYRTLQYHGVDAEKAFESAGLSSDILWSNVGSERTWTYEMWFGALRLGYRELGSSFPVLLSKTTGLAMYPMMEKIIATAPSLTLIYDMFEGWQQELEPLLSMTQHKVRGNAWVCMDYKLRGRVLEAFAMTAAQMCVNLARSTAGHEVDAHVFVNFPDVHDNFKAWSDFHGVPMTYKETQKSTIAVSLPEAVMTQPAVGSDPSGFIAARDKYYEAVEELISGTYKADLVDFAATIMMTAQNQFTRERICEELGVSTKHYSAAIAARGMTHQQFVDACNKRRIDEMKGLGYNDQKCCENLGFNDNRKLKRLMERVS